MAIQYYHEHNLDSAIEEVKSLKELNQKIGQLTITHYMEEKINMIEQEY